MEVEHHLLGKKTILSRLSTGALGFNTAAGKVGIEGDRNLQKPWGYFEASSRSNQQDYVEDSNRDGFPVLFCTSVNFFENFRVPIKL
jgi:hypothetical protein